MFLTSLFFLIFTIAHCQELPRQKEVDDGRALARLLREIETGKQELARLDLKHSPKKITYTEVWKRSDGVETKHKVTDFAWKEIGLKIMRLQNGTTKIIKIRKEGLELANPNKEFAITIEQRPSGIIWNAWNTAFVVQDLKYPADKWAVILNRYPRRLKNGQRKDEIYSPYSTALRNKSLTNYGAFYFANIEQQSFADLERLDQPELVGGKWRVVTGEELLALKYRMPGFMLRLALMEQSSPFEFAEFINSRSSFDPFERATDIFALNQQEAFSVTISPADASGAMQFTNKTRGLKLGTWDIVRKKYPWANLPKFEIGARDHLESIKAAYLLTHLNFKILERSFGKNIIDDPNLEHYLAAMYNGGEGPVIEAIRTSRRNSKDWRLELRKRKKTNESIDYLEKLDYLLKILPNR